MKYIYVCKTEIMLTTTATLS